MNRQLSPLPSPSSRRSSDGAHCLLLMLPQAAYIVAQKPIQSNHCEFELCKGQSSTSEKKIKALGTSCCMFCDAVSLMSVYTL
ncbi:hypothetical protein HID58_031883 [Brassica napus]|uniref:Uncharacterized protein n=1 Tax=Brassica napus TaxID=3708 RepID=A0ABQ8BUQ6_BRANA|nr:hypothetical protein HID58_031883 [Brassica napus]